MKTYERLGHVRNKRRSPELNAWTNMIGRCTNHRRPDYRFYGGRGIAVCAEWRARESLRTRLLRGWTVEAAVTTGATR